jgi:hypothetical protein
MTELLFSLPLNKRVELLRTYQYSINYPKYIEEVGKAANKPDSDFKLARAHLDVTWSQPPRFSVFL